MLHRNPSKRVGDCRGCGRSGVIVEKHHLYRRSLRPDLKNDPKNKVDLCLFCHRTVTENRVAEEALQQKLYPDPPKPRAKNDLNPPFTMNNKAKEILLSKARALRVKASNKEREVARLRAEADQIEASARQLNAAA